MAWSLLRSARELLFGRMVLWHRFVAGRRPPRRAAAAKPDTPPAVFRIPAGDGPREAADRLARVLQTGFPRVLEPGQKVLVKVNLNSGRPYPASTCPEMLVALLGMLRDLGIRDLLVGDCSSVRTLPTRRVARTAGLAAAVEGLARLVCFDEQWWVSVAVEGRHLHEVTVPATVFEVDRIVALANLKSHAAADFSLGLKLGVGFVHPVQRWAMHRENLREKVVALLRRAGCVLVEIGVEGATQRELDAVGKRTTVEASERAIALCRSLGLSVHAYMLTGFEGETLEDLDRRLDWVKRVRPSSFSFDPIHVHPASPLYRRKRLEFFETGDWTEESIGAYYQQDHLSQIPAEQRREWLRQRLDGFARRHWLLNLLRSNSPLRLLGLALDESARYLRYRIAGAREHPRRSGVP